MKRYKHSTSPLWEGLSLGDSPHGLGVLYTLHESLGRIPIFEGTMEQGRFVSGILYKVSGTTIYKCFEGDFNGEGTSFDQDNLVVFMGPFRNGRPYGFGWGTIRLADVLCDFSGTYEHVYKTGTLFFDSCRYIGALHPITGWPCGRGLFIDGGIHVDGTASIEGSRLLFQGRGPFPDFSDSEFPKLRFVNGNFEMNSLFLSLHGRCAVVFHSGTDLLKVVGTFHHDTIEMNFDVYKITENDAVFTSETLNTGQKVAHIRREDEQYRIQRYDASGQMDYDGYGLFCFKESWFCIWADGLGTKFENGHPHVTGDFNQDELCELHVLYDSAGRLLWRVTHRGNALTGMLDGTGIVFSETGTILYTLQFEDGVLLDEDAFWKSMPRSPVPALGDDPITKEPFRKGRLGLRLNGVVYAFTTIKDYWATTEFGRDPVYGTRTLRMDLLKFT
jgi:hypothetical protein